VATDVGGVREVVINGSTGLLIPSGDRAALVDALRRLAADPTLRQRMGRAAQQRARQAFGMDRFVVEVANLYRELAGRA
jgi:glycosyltransferase involved in cell wall biosynthesis